VCIIFRQEKEGLLTEAVQSLKEALGLDHNQQTAKENLELFLPFSTDFNICKYTLSSRCFSQQKKGSIMPKLSDYISIYFQCKISKSNSKTSTINLPEIGLLQVKPNTI